MPGQLLCHGVDVYYLRRHLMHRSLYHARSLNRNGFQVMGLWALSSALNLSLCLETILR